MAQIILTETIEDGHIGRGGTIDIVVNDGELELTFREEGQKVQCVRLDLADFDRIAALVAMYRKFNPAREAA